MLNLGACAATVELLTPRIGAAAALRLHIRGIASFGQAVHGLDPDDIEALARRRLRGATDPDAAALKGLLLDIKGFFAEETGQPWPEDPAEQIEAAARAMARAWNAPTARILRQVKGAPDEAGMGLIVQRLALGVGPGASGAGALQRVSSRTGAPEIIGSFVPRGQGHPPAGRGDTRALTRAAACRRPHARGDLPRPRSTRSRPRPSRRPTALADACLIEYALEDGRDFRPRRRAGPPRPPAPPSASPSTSPTPAPSPARRRCSASSRAA